MGKMLSRCRTTVVSVIVLLAFLMVTSAVSSEPYKPDSNGQRGLAQAELAFASCGSKAPIFRDEIGTASGPNCDGAPNGC